MGVKSILNSVSINGKAYSTLVFICPGCKELGESGVHSLPVNTELAKPQWNWDGNLKFPTLSPSILTHKDNLEKRCHSFLEVGVFRYLSDCSHSMADQLIPMPDIPEEILSIFKGEK